MKGAAAALVVLALLVLLVSRPTDRGDGLEPPAPAREIPARSSELPARELTAAREGAAPARAPALPKPRPPGEIRDQAETDGQAWLAIRVREGGLPTWSQIELGLWTEDASSERVVLLQTDEHGRLDLALPPGDVRVAAWAETAVAPPLYAVALPGEHLVLDVELERGRQVHGRVLDAETGAPVPDARLSVWTAGTFDVVRSAPDGLFVHPRFPPGSMAQQIRVEAQGYASAVRYVRIDEAGRWSAPSARTAESQTGTGDPWIEVALQRELRVRGWVLDMEGEPIAGAELRAEGFVQVHPSIASPDAAEGHSGPGGEFELGGLRADVGHSLRVRAPGYAERVLEIDQSDGARLADVGVIRLEREARLAGRVLGAPGQDLALLEVILEGGSPTPAPPRCSIDLGLRLQGRELRTRTAPDGAFEFEGLDPRRVRWTLRVLRADELLLEQEVELGPPGAPLEVYLPQ